MRAVATPFQEIAPASARISVSRYTSAAELEKENIALFRRRPVIAAHLADIPATGDFVTVDIGGVPLIVLRTGGDAIRVLVNVCRHRGARLIDGSAGSCKKALTCPYHAWTYNLDGQLIHVPHQASFADLDASSLALRRVAHEVRHGFVWVCIEPNHALDVAGALGEAIDDDLRAFDLASHQVANTAVHVRQANWKLIMDAFAEGYHLKSLHRATLARFFLETSILDDFSPHVRQLGARKSLTEIADDPVDSWDFRKHTTLFYNLFPNVVLVFHPHWISQLSLFPEAVDRVRVVHRMLIPAATDVGAQRDNLDKSFAHIDGQVFQQEDLMIAESIQKGLLSGANEHVLLGAMEEGMRLFHQARDRALNQ